MIETYANKYIAWYENYNSQSYLEVPQLFAKEFIFEDALITTRDIQRLQKYLSGMQKDVKNPKFTFHKAFFKDNDASIYWVFTFDKWGMRGQVKGSWLVTFNKQGQVVSHIDYMDFYSQVAEHIPYLGGLFRAARKIIQYLHLRFGA